MGAMGRYIAALPAAARDRLVTGQQWIAHELSDGEGGACLRGHAEGFAQSGMPTWRISQIRHSAEYVPGMFGWHDNAAQEAGLPVRRPAIRRFNLALERWGPRVVRAIKLRAARLNGSDTATIAAILAPTEAPALQPKASVS